MDQKQQAKGGVGAPLPAPEWGSDAVAAAVRALGVRHIALVPGASFRGFHDSLVNYLGNSEPEMLVCLHEEHAVAIAEGYARAAEKPMAVALHANVGLMHAAMPIYNAWCSRTPILIIGANGPVDAHERRPWIDWIHTSGDNAAIVRDYVKWDNQPASAEAAVEAVFRAHQIATTAPKGPTYVCLDVGMQEARLGRAIAVPDAARFGAPSPPAANDVDLARIVAVLRGAKAPVVLVGRVSRDIGDWEKRIAFAEALGAPVLTSMHTPAAFPSAHRLHRLAVCPERPSPEEVALIGRADLILSFDWLDLGGYLRACLGAAQTQAPAGANVIQCSLDASIANGWSMDHQAMGPADINIAADPDVVTGQLLSRLAAAGNDAANPMVDPVFAESIPHWADAAQATGDDTAEAMSMTTFGHSLADFADGRDVTFARLPIGWPSTASRFDHPLSYIGKDAGGAVGTGPGHAIGTALALRGTGRLVAGVIGDGDFLMGVSALWTAASAEIPLLLVIANNGSYHNDVKHQERVAIARGRPVENKHIGQRLDEPRPDLAALAGAQGFATEPPVNDRATFAAALERAAAVVSAGGRYLIDARVLGY